MTMRLGLSTGFALNRFTAPEEWIPLVAEEFGVRRVQFTADLLNPAIGDDLVRPQLDRIRSLAERHRVRIESTFTSAFTLVNHLSHPDPAMREYWKRWFFRWVDISTALGAQDMGSHFGILTVRDSQDPVRREERFRQTVEAWREIAAYGASKGLARLQWEPMSVAREYGETLREARRIHSAVNAGLAIPMKLCLDVDHGDVSSSDPADTDPYAWIREFSRDITMIHLKQSLKDKGGHWPFTPERNKDGKIQADRFVRALEDAGLRDVTLILELSFREREPFDSRVVQDIKASVEYWRPYAPVD